MPSYKKRGKRKRCSVAVMRKGVRKSRTFDTKAAAMAWAESVTSTSNARHSLADALRRYSEEVSPTKRGARWERVRIARFLRTIPFIHRPVDRIGADELSAWRDARLKEVSAGSVARELNILSALFTHARREWRWVSANPCADISWPAKVPPRSRRITPAEQAAILVELGWQNSPPETLQQQAALAFLIAIETAMRAGEILSIAPEQLHLDRRFVHLTRTKNGDSRDVPLSTEAVRLFKMLDPKDGRVFQISSASLDSLFRRARDAAGINNLHFHDSRATAITRLAKKLSPYELAAMSGHRDLKMIMAVYYRPDPLDAAAKLD